MSTGTFVLKNALRNKRRAGLCILSVAVSLFLFVTLLVALREITIPPEDVGAASRIIVRNKISLGTLLPARQRAVLERLPGVAAVTPFTWYGGKFRDEDATLFGQFAVDPLKLPVLLPEARVPPEQWAAFFKDRRACLVGKIVADQYHFQLGDRLPFTGTIWPCDLELRVAGIYEGTLDDRNVFFHHDYLNEAVGELNQVGTWWVKARSLDQMAEVVAEINHAFANTAAEVRAETERAFQMSMISMWGNIRILVRSICSVVVFTLVLVSASTMNMAVRERFRELAVLKALGFRRRQLFAFILAESFGLALAGALVGVGGAWFFYSHVSIARLTQGIFITFEVTPRILGQAWLIAVGLGIGASIAPAVAVARMSVVEGLKTLD
ncbi:MAG: ABC transporter permease [Verrucomicrobia bacterium]|nr:ABC transporter permease [Verrucomicrobiota bacterium]